MAFLYAIAAQIKKDIIFDTVISNPLMQRNKNTFAYNSIYKILRAQKNLNTNDIKKI